MGAHVILVSSFLIRRREPPHIPNIRDCSSTMHAFKQGCRIASCNAFDTACNADQPMQECHAGIRFIQETDYPVRGTYGRI